MTSPIIDFIEARLAEDEKVAQTAASLCGCHPAAPDWTFIDDPDDGDRIVIENDPHTDRLTKLKLTRKWHRTYTDGFHAKHIALHDPARVLREVAAKRRVMERHCLYDGIGSKHTDYCMGCPSGDDSGYPEVEIDECPELRDLAAPYTDHPDYRKEWAA